MEFVDRTSENPNRFKITYEDSGSSSYAKIELADNPIEVGTPLNRNTFQEMQKELNAYVVGNVLITSTNENPSTYLGGSWELIDKEYKSAFIYGDKSNDYYDKTMVTIDDKYYTNNNGIDIVRAGHTITIRLNISLNYEILPDENLAIGFLHFSNLGCKKLAVKNLPSLAFNDGTGNGAFWYIDANEGYLNIIEDLRGKGFVKGNELNFYVELNIPYQYMLDDFCDKFYWKRIK